MLVTVTKSHTSVGKRPRRLCSSLPSYPLPASALFPLPSFPMAFGLTIGTERATALQVCILLVSYMAIADVSGRIQSRMSLRDWDTVLRLVSKTQSFRSF